MVDILNVTHPNANENGVNVGPVNYTLFFRVVYPRRGIITSSDQVQEYLPDLHGSNNTGVLPVQNDMLYVENSEFG